jgi:hypothetical protein
MNPPHLFAMNPPHQPILARHWGILRYLGYPSSPRKEKWNSTVGKILRAQSWTTVIPAEEEEGSEEEVDEEDSETSSEEFSSEEG